MGYSITVSKPLLVYRGGEGERESTICVYGLIISAWLCCVFCCSVTVSMPLLILRGGEGERELIEMHKMHGGVHLN